MEFAQNLLLCYNKGCGKEFDPKNNTEDSCVYHPGVPVFHDALKGWSCCNKKSTDFSTFLSIPGCLKSFHSNVKAPEPEKPKDDANKLKEVVVKAPKPPERMIRPNENEEFIVLPVNVSPSLQAALEKLSHESISATVVGANLQIPIGTPCKNHGCQKTYVGENSNFEECIYHPGTAVFHEGMKYWSCCQRKTSDFDGFLNQEGCTKSNHIWHKKEDDNNEKNTSCRHDFHQTGAFAIVTIFSKNPNPNESIIKANRVSLDIKISFEGGTKTFNRKFILNGIIDLNNSQVHYFPTKVEIKMRKAEPVSWKKLEF